MTAGVSILSGTVLVCLILYFGLKDSKVKPPEPPEQEPAAELVSASGMVLVQAPGRSEWREVKSGEPLMEGELVRTDTAGEAGIRYRNGTTVSIPEKTVFTIRRAADNRIEISVPPGTAALPPLLMAEEDGNPADGAQAGPVRPYIELQQIIPFGRSLELIGRIEPGSRLVINDEIAEVTGDGSFKHFTSPFPASADEVRINLKVTDLAGRTRIWTATHNFSPDGGERSE